MTSSLREIQELLSRALRHPAPLETSPEHAEGAQRVAAGNDRLSPVEQADIYREQFFLRHLGCLDEDYPGVKALVGQRDFDELCASYLEAFPPTSFSLRDLGADLASHVEKSWRAEPDTRLLVDMVRFEWALVEAFDAADMPPLDPSALQGASPEAFDGARLTFDPSVVLLSMAFPVHEVHRPLVEGEDVELPGARSSFVVVYRRDDRSLDWEEISPEAFLVLSALREGRPLSEALDAVAASLPDEKVAVMAESVGGWFGQWVQLGLVRAVTFLP